MSMKMFNFIFTVLPQAIKDVLFVVYSQ